jgi:hypothetical protein
MPKPVAPSARQGLPHPIMPTLYMEETSFWSNQLSAFSFQLSVFSFQRYLLTADG